MKKRKVISNKNMPVRPPVMGTLVWYLVLDKFGAPGWAWGVLWTLLIVVWVAAILDIFLREQVEVIKGDGDT